MSYPYIRSFLIVSLAIGCASCVQDNTPGVHPEMEWTNITSTSGSLSPGISVFEGVDSSAPLAGWYALIDLDSPDIEVHVEGSDEEDGRETTSSMANDLNACLVVNAGYFRMDLNPSRHVGLLVSRNRMLHGATPGVFKEDKRFEIARAAIGLTDSGTADIAWASSRGDSVFAWMAPPAHAPGQPAPPLDYALAEHWPVVDAVSGGPALLEDGELRITIDEEVFFGSSIPNTHPRTAAGLTEDGKLILMVIDGRQSSSRGVDLEELARLMGEVGAVEALNLDGGGSSSFVVNGNLLNRPTGGTTEREVVSVIAVHCR